MEKSRFLLVGLLIVAMFLFLMSPAPTVATTRCVNPGGSGGCFASIQAAINASLAGDTVNVAAGTYVEDITLKAGVQVIGAGAGSSIIQGTGGTSVVRAFDSSIANDTLLQGFTITGGNANVTTLSFGGGVFVNNGASPTIIDNLITGNRATLGGGINASNGSNPVIEDNTITGNSSEDAGGVRISGSSPTVINNQITNNNATEDAAGQAGGMLIIFSSASPVVTGNTISGNVSSCDGGGIVVQESSAPTITGNTIQNNRATGSGNCGLGGGLKYYNNAGGTFENNIVKDNTANTDGGGLYVERNSTPTINRNKIINNEAKRYGGGIVSTDGSNPNISNNYIARNKATLEGGGIFVNDTAPTIMNNTIVANNAIGSGEGVYSWPGSAAPIIVNNIIVNNNYGIRRSPGTFYGTANYNDVWNNTQDYVNISPDPNDISGDPLFVDAANDNYQLSTGSPAIDAGTNTGAPATDIDGVARPQDADADGSAIVDMGAHELSPADAQLDVSPTQAVFHYDPNDLVKSPSAVFTGTITIRNTGVSKNLTYTITPPSSPPFAVTTLDPLSGDLTPLGNTNFRYNIDVSGLVTGTYNTTFTVSATQDGGGAAPGSPAMVQVRAIIGPFWKVYLPIITKDR